MLKQRVLWAGILLIVVFLTLFVLPRYCFILMLFTVLMLAGWEWSNLIAPGHRTHSTGYTVSLVLSALALYFLIPVTVQQAVIYLGALWWVAVFVLLIVSISRQCLYPTHAVAAFQRIAGFFTLLPASLALYRLYDHHSLLVFYVIILTSAGDIGGYFVGKWLGRRRLAPLLSPGKTVEGFIGGIIVTVLATIALAIPFSVSNIAAFIIVGIVITLTGVTGDLFESVQKRLSGVKESGWLLPGHGGILDRIDSLVAVAPLFSLMVDYWQI